MSKEQERKFELLAKSNKTSLEELELIKLCGCRIGKNYIGFETIEKELKALKIIKEKNVDLRDLKAYFKVECGLQEYNRHQYKENELTQEEYDLLKEMLENELF